MVCLSRSDWVDILGDVFEECQPVLVSVYVSQGLMEVDHQIEGVFACFGSGGVVYLCQECCSGICGYGLRVR